MSYEKHRLAFCRNFGNMSSLKYLGIGKMVFLYFKRLKSCVILKKLGRSIENPKWIIQISNFVGKTDNNLKNQFKLENPFLFTITFSRSTPNLIDH